MDWKSEQEKIILEYFKDLYPDFPKGRMIKQESPDLVVLTSPKSSIGIELTRIHPLDNPHHNDASIDPKRAFEQIEKTIRNKEEKLGSYQAPNMREIWLIIFADEAPLSLVRRISNRAYKQPYYSQFTRTFLFIISQKEIIEL